MKYLFSFGFLIFVITFAKAQVTLSGSLTGAYTKLSTAFNSINAAGGIGNVTVTITGNITESSSATLVQSNYLVTVTATTNVVVSGTFSAPIVNLNGADNAIINGTTAKLITFRNSSTSTAAAAINITNNADGNTITNCILEGSTKAQFNNGVVNIKGASNSSGCDLNTISFCTIKEAGINLPQNGITMEGATFGLSTIANVNNKILSNNIVNVFNPTGYSIGVYSYRYNSNTQISNNSFYQTAIRTASGTSQNHRMVEIDDGFYGGANGRFYINGNFCGGSAAQAMGTPTTITNTTGPAVVFGIFLASTATDTSYIFSNKITNITLNSTFSSTSDWFKFIGIDIVQGKAQVFGNTIGSATTNNVIAINATMTGANSLVASGIVPFSTSSVNISNNTIGGISANVSGSSTGLFKLWGAYTLNTDACTFDNNTLGSYTLANNISINSTSTTIGTQLWGIGAESGNVTINNNTIQNLTNNGLNSSLFGIGYWAGATNKNLTCKNNWVNKIGTVSGKNLTIAGIGVVTSTSTLINYTHAIDSNYIHDVLSTAATNPNDLFGILVTKNLSAGLMDGYANGTIKYNEIFRITSTGTDANSTIAGIFSNQGHNVGLNVAHNSVNVLRAGVGNMTGISVQTNLAIKPNSVACNINNNTIYDITCNNTGSGLAHSGMDVDVKLGNIFNNKIGNITAPNLTGTSTNTGLQLYFSDAQTMSARNNAIYISSDSDINTYGISIQKINAAATAFANIDYNSIVVEGYPNPFMSKSAAFAYLGLVNLLSVKNNIFYNNRYDYDGHSYYNGISSSFPSAFKNNYHVSQDSLSRIGFPSYSMPLAFWKNSYGADLNSIERTAGYGYNETQPFNLFGSVELDLNLNNFDEVAYLQNKGTPINTINTDINGMARSITEPDLGAQEFSDIKGFNAKVFLNNVNPTTGLMEDYFRTLSNFPTSDPYATAPLNTSFIHVNNPIIATILPSILTGTGNNAIVDWVFIELRTGTSGTTNVAYTKAALLQRDGDIVSTDGFSAVTFPNITSGNYYITIRHRTNLGFRTEDTYPLTSTSKIDFTNGANSLYGITPIYILPNSGGIEVMCSGDANSDGSIDSTDSAIWENQNGLFDSYLFNSDYNLDGSVDSTDSAIWEIHNGKYEELD